MKTTTRTQAPNVTANDITLEVITAPTYAGGVGVIVLNGKVYAVSCHGSTSRDGFRLVSADGSRTYDLDTSTGVACCDCPDGTYRQRACKHAAGLTLMRKQGHI